MGEKQGPGGLAQHGGATHPTLHFTFYQFYQFGAQKIGKIGK